MTEELLRKMRLRLNGCPNCKGAGFTQKTALTYETDTPDEIDRAWRNARVWCRECAEPDPVLLLKYIDQLQDALQILRAWRRSVEYDGSVHVALTRWIDGGMAGPVPWPDSPFFAEWAAKRGLFNDGGYVARRSALRNEVAQKWPRVSAGDALSD